MQSPALNDHIAWKIWNRFDIVIVASNQVFLNPFTLHVLKFHHILYYWRAKKGYGILLQKNKIIFEIKWFNAWIFIFKAIIAQQMKRWHLNTFLFPLLRKYLPFELNEHLNIYHELSSMRIKMRSDSQLRISV